MADINATDSALELAEDNDIDLSEVEGTGADGKIIKRDVEALLQVSSDEEAEEVEKVEPKKVETTNLTASFKIRTKEGDRLQFVFRGSGKDLKEAIEDLKCLAPEEEEGKDYPRDLKMLVNVKVKRGDFEFSRALAPHVARACIGRRENLEYLELLLGLRKA